MARTAYGERDDGRFCTKDPALRTMWLRESTKRGRGERCRDMRGFCYGLLLPTKLRGSYPETIPDVCDES